MESIGTLRTAGVSAMVAGLVTFALSKQITSGFVHGLFQGMTIGLMLCAAYFFGAQWRQRLDEDDGGRDPDALWLPSQDEDRR